MEMKIKDWTVGELVAYLTGKSTVVDEWLDHSLWGDKGLVSGTLHIRLNPAKLKRGESDD